MRKYFIFLIFNALFQVCVAQETFILDFSGYLSLDKLQSINNQLDEFEGEELLLKIDSRTGELDSSLALAKRLFDLKVAKEIKITVYIENQALGPSAVFPLLADRLLGTPSFTWGNILYESKVTTPFDQLQSRVVGLVADNVPNSYILRLAAQAMIDPGVDVVNQNGWKLIPVHPPHEEGAVFTRSDLVKMQFEVETLLREQFNIYYEGNVAAPMVSSAASVDKRLAEMIPYKKDQENLIGQLFIGPDRPIDQTTYLHVKLALEEYRKKNVIFIMVRVNTPGGEVLPAMKIAELLQEFDRENHIPVVAVIYNWALSAGAMIAYASRFIAVTDNALMGAAEPVVAAGSQRNMEPASEKMVSALRAEFASLAKFYGRDPLIAEAMVDRDIVLVIRDGKIIQLQNDSEIRSQGDHPDEVITTKGKLLTLDSEQLLRLGIADIPIPIVAAPVITPQEMKMGKWPAKQSQLFNYPFFSNIPYGEVIYYYNWKVSFYSFLTNPIVASLLMLGFLLGIYMELSQPGFGMPGIVTMICLGLILLSNFVLETIGWLEILMIAIGIALILAELLLMPGFGILAVAGVAFILFAIIALFLPHLESVHFSWNWNEWNLATIEFMDSLAFYLAAVIIALAIIALLARFVTPRLLKKSRIVLEGEQEGFIAGPEPASLPAVNSEGEAFTSLRPGGKVLIAFHLYDALTEEGFIEKGEKVIISKIRGNVIIVAKNK